MGRRGNDANIPAALAIGLVEASDGHQSGILACCSRVGLQGD